MKILFILEYYEPNVGGVEKLFKTLAESLVKAGHKVEVLTNRYERSLKPNEVINDVHIKRIRCFNRFLFTVLAIPFAIRMARNCDLIHTSSYNAALPARIAAKFQNKKSIITFHEIWDRLWFDLPFINYFQKHSFRKFEQLILKLKFDQFIAVSDSTKLDLIEAGIDSSKITRIYNGIDYSQINPKPQKTTNDFIFTYLGRLGISKGLDLLIPAASKLILDFPNTQFKLICPNQPKSILKKIKELIKKYNIESQTSILHFLDQSKIRSEIQKSNCVVIPSYSEGFCFVAAEVAALGVPIVSSGRKALTEVVSGKEVKIDELSAEGIYNALVKAKNNKFQKTPLKKFELNDSVKSYIDLYSRL